MKLSRAPRHEAVGMSSPLWVCVHSGFCSDSYNPYLWLGPAAPATVLLFLLNKNLLQYCLMVSLPFQFFLSSILLLPGGIPGKQITGPLCFDNQEAVYSFLPKPQENLFWMVRPNSFKKETYRCDIWGSPWKKKKQTNKQNCSKSPVHAQRASNDTLNVLLLNMSEQLRIARP